MRRRITVMKEAWSIAVGVKTTSVAMLMLIKRGAPQRMRIRRTLQWQIRYKCYFLPGLLLALEN